MFKNYFKIAIRNLLNFKSYTIINIAGLALGLTCAILIMIWVQDELSMDGYHEKIDHIYQANLKLIRDGITGYQATVSPVIGSILKNEYPEISDVVRMCNLDEVVLKTNDKMILESSGISADPSVFRIFTFPLLQGDPLSVLTQPHSIVLTESMAKKYFGDQQPLGKIIRINSKADLQVTGVIRDLPRNSSNKFDFVVPFVFLKEMGYNIEGTPFYPCQYSTYVVLKDNISYTSLSDKIEKRLFASGKTISFSICLLPFKDAYLRITDSTTKITILSLIAFFILVIACINFTNLTTARSSTRRKEIGVRKVAGASRFQLSKQFLIESTLLVVIAVVISLALTDQFRVLLNKLTGKSLTIPYTDPAFILCLIGLIIITSVCAGIYPALYLSRYKPVEIFKKQSMKPGKSILRKALIVFQFSLSIAFIICTIVMNRQIKFVHNFNLGVNQYNIVYVGLEGEAREKYELVKNELLKNPDISYVTSSSNYPVLVGVNYYYNWGKNDNIARKIFPVDVGYDYLQTFDLQMAAGRFYSKDYPGDLNGSIVVNEAAIKTIGMKSPVGKPFFYNGKYYTLIGIVKDFHFNKLLPTPPEPMALRLIPGGSNLLFAKINPNISDLSKAAEISQFIQKVCNRFSPERPLQSQFLSDLSLNEEKSIEAMKEIIFYATLLAILISCLGLFGLSMFVSQQKTKEIGIRKTLGASVANVVNMLSKEFVKWVLVANIFAWPAAYLVMDNWLQRFAYRTDLGWWIFALSGSLALVIAFVTVSWQTIKAATANPVKSLKYE
jgi:ABC-type antimicrobial peptide transport system permease subunit